MLHPKTLKWLLLATFNHLLPKLTLMLHTLQL